MRELFAKLIIIIVDILAIALSVTLAYELRNSLTILTTHDFALQNYLTLYAFYIIPISIFVYEGLYTHRYDFWHESWLLFKGIFFALVILLAYLAITKSVQEYSRVVIVLSFAIMAFLLPLFKRIVKNLLYYTKLWQKRAKVYGDDELLKQEIFGNFYLGYKEAKEDEDAHTVLISSKGMDIASLSQTIDRQLRSNHEVLFVPLLNDFDLARSTMYELFNVRKNLISLKNRLKSRYRKFVKYTFDYTASILLLPILLPVMGIIAILIYIEKSGKDILFTQQRLGQNGKLFYCYKFRTMVDNGDIILQEYLQNNPDEIDYYQKYHKYKNDPRVTPVGKFLRKSSLDELPQIFNVLKGEMSLVGPRPYMPNEKGDMGSRYSVILSVRPGITGLWQVGGRNDIDFEQRSIIDVWYIRNWNLWMDIVILLKTFKAVIIKDGAY